VFYRLVAAVGEWLSAGGLFITAGCLASLATILLLLAAAVCLVRRRRRRRKTATAATTTKIELADLELHNAVSSLLAVVITDGTGSHFVTQRPSDPGIQRPGNPVDPVTLFYNELRMSTYVRRSILRPKNF